MRKLGISVYTGLGQSVSQNIGYLKLAKKLGYEKLFTSLHIPEADYRTFLSDSRRVLDEAVNLGLEVTADVAPGSWELLEIIPSDLKMWGIHTLRMDYGFSPWKIRELSDVSGLCIELNASTMLESDLTSVLSTGVDRRSLRAGHNYYPRPDTGLSYGLFVLRSECFRALNIPVSAFIPNVIHPRGPVFSGLPTVEAHRRMTPLEAARQFWASEMVDSILFSDPLVSESDLTDVAALPQPVPSPLQIRVEVDKLTEGEAAILWAAQHTNRVDAAGYVVRSQESRKISSRSIPPQHDPRERRRGDITIDNCQYGRYEGELQILLQDMPADMRVNVVGRIINDDLCLLDCLLPGRSFCFKGV